MKQCDAKNKRSENIDEQNVPHHKQIIKYIIKLEANHVNSTDLMKNVSIKCHSLSHFLTFYQTLKYHFSNFNVFIRDVNDITKNDFSEPAGLKSNSDAANFMKMICTLSFQNKVHSQISQKICKP